MTERERMLSGELYLASDGELVQARQNARRLTRQINATAETETARRETLFRALFGSIGENFCIEPPFRCDYGKNTRIGSDFYANFDCIILDVAPVTIGDHVFFGPRVSLFAAGHPIDAAVRDSLLEYGKPITIGSHVWIGGNTVINPGVTVGDNVVIGAGSVVTRDIPKNCVAAGVPCRVIREITEADRAYWQAQADRRRGEAD